MLVEDTDYTVDDIENIFGVINGIVSIFNNIVQQGGTDACRAKTHLFACYESNSQWVHDIWLA